MKKVQSLLIVLFGLTLTSTAQTIQMEFPHLSGKTYDLILFQGDAEVKVSQDIIPKNGKFALVIPKEYAPYTGMCRWLITNSAEGGGLNMLIPGKDFSVSCLVERPTKEEDFIYEGNPDNKVLNTLFNEQQKILLKANAIIDVLNAFDKTAKNYTVYEEEYASLKNEYATFQSDVLKNPAYAAKVLNVLGMAKGIGTELTRTEEELAKNLANYIANDLDFNVLYTSGYWTNIITSWTDIHTIVLQDKAVFATDFKKIEKKTDVKLFTDIASRVAYSLAQKGQDDYIATLAPVVNTSTKVLSFEGSMNAYKANLVGLQAPDILIRQTDKDKKKQQNKALKSKDFASGDYKKTLVVFYESGCGPCENLLQQLPGYYEDLKKKGLRIIAISADTDEEIFKSRSSIFPWKDSFCDYQGKSGVNFKNYGAVGTPTLFLIDKSGKVEAKMAGLDEVLEKLKYYKG